MRIGDDPCAWRLVSRSPDELVAAARAEISRVQPAELAAVEAEGGIIVDIRPAAQRAEEGELPGALVIERNVLEWRLDPDGAHRLPVVRGADQAVVVVCSEGYASSLAAAGLAAAGHTRVADLAGGYRAWLAWSRVAARTAGGQGTGGAGTGGAGTGGPGGTDADSAATALTPPRRFAERYVEIVNRGDYGELADLFAEDAVWLGPNRQELAGRPAIGAFYERFLGEITPQIRIAHYVEAGDECVYELEARTVGRGGVHPWCDRPRHAWAPTAGLRGSASSPSNPRVDVSGVIRSPAHWPSAAIAGPRHR